MRYLTCMPVTAFLFLVALCALVSGCTTEKPIGNLENHETRSTLLTSEDVRSAIESNKWPHNLTEVRAFSESSESGPKFVHYAVVLEDPTSRHKFYGMQRLVILTEAKHGLAMAEINVLPDSAFAISIAYNGVVRTISAPDGRVPLEYHPKEQPVEWPVETPAFLSYGYYSKLEEEAKSGLAKSEYDALLQRIWFGLISDDLFLIYDEGDGESSGIFAIKFGPDGAISTQKLRADFEPQPMRLQYDMALRALEG